METNQNNFLIQTGTIEMEKSHGWTDKGNGFMAKGEGYRESVKYIKFEKPFSKPPQVIVSLSGFDCGDTVIRVKVITRDITNIGFNCVFITWHTSKIYGVKANYFAHE